LGPAAILGCCDFRPTAHAHFAFDIITFDARAHLRDAAAEIRSKRKRGGGEAFVTRWFKTRTIVCSSTLGSGQEGSDSPLEIRNLENGALTAETAQTFLVLSSALILIVL